MSALGIDRLMELTFKTTLGYLVFALSFVSVPFSQQLWQDITADFVNTTASVVIGESTINVDVVESDSDRAKGLSGRDSLDYGDGMLFIFSKPAKHGIWMKDMNFSIDIIWVALNKQVVHIEENVSPSTYPKIFKSDSNALYVVETPAGFVKKEGIMMGDLMTVI